MKEPVLIQHDDDVEVYNRPAASEYYHTQVIVDIWFLISRKKRKQRVSSTSINFQKYSFQPPPSIEDEMWIENSVFICYNIL